MTDIPNVVLNNGVRMPQLGLGVWQTAEGFEVTSAVSAALSNGYRLIDTAAIYGNEEGVGQAVRESGIPRDQVFITSKVWNEDQGYDSTLRAFEASLERLGLQYIDLYLIHWPAPAKGKYIETWQALEKLYEAGVVRAIGVSNFKTHHLDALLQEATIIPAVNQVELHPRLQQREVRDLCHEYNIQIESYSPLMRAGEVLENPIIRALADKYDKTPAQIVLRWHIQHNLVVIPKSVNPDRIKENIDVFDFEMSDADMESINDLDANVRVVADPDTANF